MGRGKVTVKDQPAGDSLQAEERTHEESAGALGALRRRDRRDFVRQSLPVLQQRQCNGNLERYVAYKRDHPASIKIKKHRKGSKALRSFDNLLQLLQRHFQEERLKLLNADQITQLEEQMESLLRQTRVKKMNLLLETVSKLRQKEKEVQEEKSQLRKEITAIQNERNRTDLQKQVIVNPSTPEPQEIDT